MHSMPAGAEGSQNSSGVTWNRVFAPPSREGTAEIIEADTPEAAAKALVDKLLAEKVI